MKRSSVPSTVQAQKALEPAPILWEPLPECLTHLTGFILYSVTSLAGQLYANAVAPLGLRPPQVGILQLLECEGNLPQARLGEKMGIDKATMVGLLNDLEQQGLVSRQPHPTDKRAFEIHLQEAGRERLKKAESVNEKMEKSFFAALSPQEQKTLRSLLKRLATSHSPVEE